MARKYHVANAYDLNWRTVQFAWDTMIAFSRRAQESEGDPEMCGAAKALEDELAQIQNYYLPLVDRRLTRANDAS